MPRGMAWLRFSMATIQRILCQWGRTVAASRRNGAARCPRPWCRRHGRRPTIRAAQPRRLPGTSWTPRDVNRYTRQRARIRGCRCASGRFILQMLHAPCGARTRPCGRPGTEVRWSRTDRRRTPASLRPHARGRVSGERAEENRAASRTQCATGAWRCVTVGDATRAVSTRPSCRHRGWHRDEAAAGASARRGAKAGASRAGRRREARPPTASLFAVRKRGCSPAAAKPGSRGQAAIEE